MNIDNISKKTPLEPYIELDGGYAVCVRCGEEISPRQKVCSCGQIQDWSWLNKNKEKMKDEENKFKGNYSRSDYKNSCFTYSINQCSITDIRN